MEQGKTIEEYQMILMRTPSAKVFAPLSEAYRKMGLLQQALEVCQKGVQYNPQYPSGHVALGKVFFELKHFEEAEKSFSTAAQLQHDNILARKLQALCLGKLGRRQEAVQVYKEILILNPSDAQAQKSLKNWEYVEAENFSSKSFPPLNNDYDEIIKNSTPSSISSYVEALIARNELNKAHGLLLEAEDHWPDDLLIKKQKEVVYEYINEEQKQEVQTSLQRNRRQQKLLKNLLQRIELAKN